MACNFSLFVKGTRRIRRIIARVDSVPRTILSKQISHNDKPVLFRSGSSNTRLAICLAGAACIGGLLFSELKSKLQVTTVHARDLRDKNYRKNFNVIADVVEQVADAVVFINSRSLYGPLFGSGFIVSSEGSIITNAHVVNNSYSTAVKVTLKDGRTFDGEVVCLDKVLDLALLKIKGKNFPTVTLGSGKDLRTGEWVAAIGSPMLLTDSVTTGVVSSVSRRSSEIGISSPNMEFIQTDAMIMQGNSGGPLVNLDAEVVGVNTLNLNVPGISFAIPVEYVKKFLKESQVVGKEKKSPDEKGYIGVTYMPWNGYLKESLERNGIHVPDFIRSGAFVIVIEPNSPASRAGLEAGDIVFELEGKPLTHLADSYEVIKRKGSAVVKFWRRNIIYSTVLK